MMWIQNVNGWMWLLMIGGAIAFWWLVFVAVKDLARPSAAREAPKSDATRLLDERLARGEIDKDQYERTRRLLTTGR